MEVQCVSRVFMKVTHMPLSFELKELWRELED